MANKANAAQGFLLDNNLPDIELTKSKDSNEWLYVSDIMMSFLKEATPKTSNKSGDQKC